MKTLELKNAIVDDIEEIVALDRLCLGGIWSADGYLREIDSPNSSLLLLWVTQGKSSSKAVGIGCLWSILEEAHITLLGIDPEYQQQGLGTLLLHSLLKDAVKRGLARATLEVKVTNQPAINLYEKFGFKFAGRRKNYYPKTGEDALILWLNGLNKPDIEQKLDDWWLQICDRISSDYRIA